MTRSPTSSGGCVTFIPDTSFTVTTARAPAWCPVPVQHAEALATALGPCSLHTMCPAVLPSSSEIIWALLTGVVHVPAALPAAGKPACLQLQNLVCCRARPCCNVVCYPLLTVISPLVQGRLHCSYLSPSADPLCYPAEPLLRRMSCAATSLTVLLSFGEAMGSRNLLLPWESQQLAG